MAALFENREDAGRQLGRRLEGFARLGNLIILGIPRGGVSVAFQVAHALGAPLDVLLSHKLGVPGQEELAFGAVAAGGHSTLDQQVIRAVEISDMEIERITNEVKLLLSRRAAIYRGERPPIKVAGKTTILVDDGIATGASMLAAVKALRAMLPAKLVIAAPVAPLDTCKRFENEVDKIVCLHAPEDFYAVGPFYRDFSQVSDLEVTSLLRRSQAGSGGSRG